MKKIRNSFLSGGKFRERISGISLLGMFLIFWMVGNQAFASAYSQKTKLSLTLKNVKLLEVFSAIEEQSDFEFFYSKSRLDVNKRVSVKADEQSVDQILEELLEGESVQYQIIDKHILITQKEKPILRTEDQQDKRISVGGTIKDAKGELIPGASISVKGTTHGTISDINGKFLLIVESPDVVLRISFVGYQSQDIPIKGQKNLEIVLRQDVQGLEEVMVVGYGVQKKSDLTGAVASVKSEDLEKLAVTNPAEALQGRLAGVSVNKYGGSPGAGVDIKIRGIGTIGKNHPLYIIDGVAGDMYFLSPEEIESIEVLKDGAAAAIYGSRAANGVVLITTKKGKKGGVMVEAGCFTSIVEPTNTYDLLDADGYVKVHRMMYENKGMDVPEYVNKPGTNNTDWIDETFRTGMVENYNVRISGANDIAHYSLSGNFSDEKGVVIGSNFTKSVLTARTGMKKGKFDIDGTLSYTETKRAQAKLSLREVYHISPLIAAYDENEEDGYGKPFNGLPKHDNPLCRDQFLEGDKQIQYLRSNVKMGLELTSWLKYQGNFGFTNSNEYEWDFTAPHKSGNKVILYNSFDEERVNWREKLMEHLLHFNKKVGIHSIQAMAGYTATHTTCAWTKGEVIGKTTNRTVENGSIVTSEEPAGFKDPSFRTLDAGIGGTYGASGSKYVYNRTSLLGRINYSLKDRYLLQMTYRRDGSSKFGENHRYGTFPSVSVGWRITEEPFMKDRTPFSNLKLRGSWGRLGNEVTLKYYDFLSLMTTYNDYRGGYVRGSAANPWPGSAAWDLANKDLQWETTESLNLGIDYGLLDGHLFGTLNFYKNNTKDMLVEKKIAPSAGLKDPIMNVGEIENRGMELEMTYSNSVNSLNYSITGTFSTLKNEVIALADNDQSMLGEGLKWETEYFVNQTRVGKEIGAFYLYQMDGIFRTQEELDAHVNAEGEKLQEEAQLGDVRFKDVNGDGVINPKDMVYSGAGIPKYEYSLNLSADFKGFDFSIYFQGAGGHKIFNGNLFEMEGMDGGRNFLATTLNAWTPENPNSNMPRAIQGDPNKNARESTRFVEDGDYLRLKNLQIGYSLPKSMLDEVKIEKVRFYVSGQNLLTFTDYSGLDPEIARSDVKNTGVDRNIYPITQSYVFGVQLKF